MKTQETVNFISRAVPSVCSYSSNTLIKFLLLITYKMYLVLDVKNLNICKPRMKRSQLHHTFTLIFMVLFTRNVFISVMLFY